MIKKAALAALLLLAAACAAPEKGTVYGRWHYPESQWVQMVCSAYDSKTGACTFQMPVIQTDPERWSLGLRDGKEEGQRSVTEREYENCQVDDYYPDCVDGQR
jgi:hypothetical protein